MKNYVGRCNERLIYYNVGKNIKDRERRTWNIILGEKEGEIKRNEDRQSKLSEIRAFLTGRDEDCDKEQVEEKDEILNKGQIDKG